MNDKKFCFISCVNNKQYYDECLYYINHLEIPEGYQTDIISIEGAQSITSGYNEAMNKSDAKYKIYLHQDTFIINKKFLYDILEVFEQDKNIGMIGMVGAKTIPPSGIWWDSDQRYGDVYENGKGIIKNIGFNKVENAYEEVKIIDGLMMISQYDICWREDKFDKWHMYDAAQSIEFYKRGYKVVVPRQQSLWTIHDCGIVSNNSPREFIRLVDVFINEYYEIIDR